MDANTHTDRQKIFPVKRRKVIRKVKITKYDFVRSHDFVIYHDGIYRYYFCDAITFPKKSKNTF